MIKDYIRAVPLTLRDAATLTGAFQAINVGGLPEACFYLRIVNDSDVAVYISYDGTVSHEYIVNGKDLDINFQTNGQPSNHRALVKQGSIISVKSATGAAGTGLIALVGYYQPKN